MLAVFLFLLSNLGWTQGRQRVFSNVTFILCLVGGKVRVLLADVPAELVARLGRLRGHSMNFASVTIWSSKCNFFLMRWSSFDRRPVYRGDSYGG